MSAQRNQTDRDPTALLEALSRFRIRRPAVIRAMANVAEFFGLRDDEPVGRPEEGEMIRLAERKARKLLRKQLSKEQYSSYIRRGAFIEMLDDNPWIFTRGEVLGPTHSYCIVPVMDRRTRVPLPPSDRVLQRLLFFRHQRGQFFKLACAMEYDLFTENEYTQLLEKCQRWREAELAE